MSDWQLVPKVLTDDMAVAFAEEWYSHRQTIDEPEMESAYAAMLAVAPGWFSTEDALPEEGQTVLAVVNGEIRLACRYLEEGGFEDPYESFLYWDDPIMDGQDWQNEDVSHWLPLPAPPQLKL